MINPRLNKKILILFLLMVLVISSLNIRLNQILIYPSEFNIIKGENKNLNISFPFTLNYNNKDNIVQPIYNENNKGFKKTYNLNGNHVGNTQLELKLLGVVPVKNYDVSVINRPTLIPGGNSIGVSLNTKGVLIVAITDVIDVKGDRKSPAKDAGLKIGDSIIAINNKEIKNAEEIVETLNKIKENKIDITVMRNKGEFTTESIPIQCIQDNSYRLGIWVRDKTTGIGTLTYFNPKNNSFAALGHGITDNDTGKLLEVDNGLVMNAKVADIEQGKKGSPGEIKGALYKSDKILGNIDINNQFGIYGSLKKDILEKNNLKPISIGFQKEVKEGRAHILTTLDNNKIEKFEIEIIKIESQNQVSQKSMIIKITDSELIKKTGGIVQGMSGSPIIQNGKIIGAVTHVFVNDPTKGYGIYIEWMLDQENKF